MPLIMNKATRMCKITTSGPIAVLGGISGPIKKCKLTNDQIISIVRSGHSVWEYNPKDSNDCRELVLDNNCQSPFVEKPTVTTKKPEKAAKPNTAPVEHVVPKPEEKIVNEKSENIPAENPEVESISESEEVPPITSEEESKETTVVEIDVVRPSASHSNNGGGKKSKKSSGKR